MELATRIERAHTPLQGAGPPLGVTSISSRPGFRSPSSRLNRPACNHYTCLECFTGDRHALPRRHAALYFQRSERTLRCGYPSWIRTSIDSFRARHPAVRRSGSAPAGNRTLSVGLRIRCSTNELQARENFVSPAGVEPAPCRLKAGCAASYATDPQSASPTFQTRMPFVIHCLHTSSV